MYTETWSLRPLKDTGWIQVFYSKNLQDSPFNLGCMNTVMSNIGQLETFTPPGKQAPVTCLVQCKRYGHGPNIYKDTKCRLFLKTASKGTWQQGFICLRPPIPIPPPPPPPVLHTLLIITPPPPPRTYSHWEGGGGMVTLVNQWAG